MHPPTDPHAPVRRPLAGSCVLRKLLAALLTLVPALGLCACGAAADGTNGRAARRSAPAAAHPTTTTTTTGGIAGAASRAGAAGGGGALTANIAAIAKGEAPCGAAAAPTAAHAAGLVAVRIYSQELASPEVRADQHQVETYTPLLSALAASNRPAIAEAVTSLVYSHTHVVRLRVTKGAQVLADVGGPYIIAPVAGSLRFRGRTVGHYVLSVQDDLGYVKLESRFVGVPLLLREGSRRVPVEGTIEPGPRAVPDSGAFTYRGSRYQVFTFQAHVFPTSNSGGAVRSLDVSLLVPPLGSAATSCGTIRVAEIAQIGHRIWQRFALVSAPASAYVNNVGYLTGALAYVRSGSRQLYGSTSPGPGRLPTAGAISYHHTTYGVRSFSVTVGGSPARVYLLIAP